MSDQYFFMFSSGSYSDYSVGGLYVCDHEVTEKEWDDFYKKYVDENGRLIAAYRDKWGPSYAEYSGTPEYLVWREYLKNSDPEGDFQKLHNMVEVPVTEMWRDC